MGSMSRHFHLKMCFQVWGCLEVNTVWRLQSELLSSHGTAFLFWEWLGEKLAIQILVCDRKFLEKWLEPVPLRKPSDGVCCCWWNVGIQGSIRILENFFLPLQDENLKSIFFLITLIYCVCAILYLWKWEGNLWELIFSSYHVHPQVDNMSIKLRLSGLEVSTLTCWAISLALELYDAIISNIKYDLNALHDWRHLKNLCNAKIFLMANVWCYRIWWVEDFKVFNRPVVFSG